MHVCKEVTTEVKHNKIETAVCELCKTFTNHTTSRLTNEWAGGYEKQETTVLMRMGEVYPEGDWTIYTALDICPSCFISKLIPWFQEQGGSIREFNAEQ